MFQRSRCCGRPFKMPRRRWMRSTCSDSRPCSCWGDFSEDAAFLHWEEQWQEWQPVIPTVKRVFFYFLWPKAVHSSDHTQLTFAHVWIRLEGKWQKKEKNGSVSVNKMFGPSPSMVWLPHTDTSNRLQLDVWQKFKGFGKGSIWVSATPTPLETRIFLLGWDSTV